MTTNAHTDAPIRLISMPFHLGRTGEGLAAGPDAILRGIAGDHAVIDSIATSRIPAVEDDSSEIACIFEINRRLSREVASSLEAGSFPLVLSGNCSCCLGTVTGLRSPRPAVVWFDAHYDSNTADTTRSGFFDGMAGAVLTGHTFVGMAESIPGFRPVRDSDVIMAGVRDFEPHERDQLGEFPVTWILGDDLRAEGAAALDAPLRELEPADIYLHVDVDSIDAEEGRVNRYAAPGGPSLKQLCESIEAVFATGKVRSAAVTAYDPDSDPDGRGLNSATAVVRTITAAAGRSNERPG